MKKRKTTTNMTINFGVERQLCPSSIADWRSKCPRVVEMIEANGPNRVINLKIIGFINGIQHASRCEIQIKGMTSEPLNFTKSAPKRSDSIPRLTVSGLFVERHGSEVCISRGFEFKVQTVEEMVYMLVRQEELYNLHMDRLYAQPGEEVANKTRKA